MLAIFISTYAEDNNFNQNNTQITIQDIENNSNKLYFYENHLADNDEINSIIKNKGKFREEITDKNNKFVLQIAKFQVGTEMKNIIIVYKNGKANKIIPPYPWS